MEDSQPFQEYKMAEDGDLLSAEIPNDAENNMFNEPKEIPLNESVLEQPQQINDNDVTNHLKLDEEPSTTQHQSKQSTTQDPKTQKPNVKTGFNSHKFNISQVYNEESVILRLHRAKTIQSIDLPELHGPLKNIIGLKKQFLDSDDSDDDLDIKSLFDVMNINLFMKWSRNIIRIMVISLLCIILLLVVNSQSLFDYKSPRIEIKKQHSIFLEIQKCDVILQATNSTKAELEFRVPDKFHVETKKIEPQYQGDIKKVDWQALIDKTNVLKLKLHNTKANSYSCTIKLYIPPKFEMKSLQINCTDECRMYTASDFSYATTIIKLTIDAQINLLEASYIGLFLNNININDLHVKSDRAVIDIPKLNLITNGQQKATVDFDILFGTIQIDILEDIDLTFLMISKENLCLRAPEIIEVQSNATKGCRITLETAEQKKKIYNQFATIPFKREYLNCSGHIQMCKSKNCGTSIPRANVKINEGSLHVTLTENPKQKLFGTYYDEGEVEPSYSELQKLKKFKDEREDTTKTPAVGLFVIGDEYLMSAQNHFQKWVASEHIYHSSKPWVLNFISGGFLASHTHIISGVVLSPDFCPKNREMPINNYYNMSQMFKNTLNITHLDMSFIVENGQKTPWEAAKTQKKVVYYQTPSTYKFDKWYDFKLDTGVYSAKEIKLQDNKWFVLALGLSLLIAFVTSCSLWYAIMHTTIYLIDKLKKRQLHIKEYQIEDSYKLHEIEQSNHNESISKQTFNVKKHGCWKKLKSYFYQWTQLPDVYCFIEYCFRQLFPWNSVLEFYDVLFTKDKPIVPQKKEVNFKTIQNIYQKYCFVSGFKEMDLQDEHNLKHLQNKGFNMKDSDLQQQHLSNIIFRKPPKKVDQDSEEKSIDLFIETQTNFIDEEDFNLSKKVYLNDFNIKYKKFCSENMLSKTQITVELLKKKDIKVVNIFKKVFYRIQSKEQQAHQYYIDIDHVQKRIGGEVSTQGLKSRRLGTDVIRVSFIFFVYTFLTLLMCLLFIYYQTQQWFFVMSNQDKMFTMQDFLYQFINKSQQQFIAISL